MPPELFPLFIECCKDVELRRYEYQLSAVCRYWATLYRPTQWQEVSLRSSSHLNSLLRILQSAPGGLPPVADLVNRIVVDAMGTPNQPWIHLVPLLLNRHLFRRRGAPPQFSLAIGELTQPHLGFYGEHLSMSRTHNSIPKGLSYFDFQCQEIKITGVKFLNLSNFLMIMRSFKRLENLYCKGIGWLHDPAEIQQQRIPKSYKYPPLKAVQTDPFPDKSLYGPQMPYTHWVAALWCWVRRRTIGKEQYLLEDHETENVMRITGLFQSGWARKMMPNIKLVVKERYKRDGSFEGTYCALLIQNLTIQLTVLIGQRLRYLL